MTDETTSSLRVAFDATPLIGQRTGVGHVTAGFLAQALQRRIAVRPYALTRAKAESLGGLIPQGDPVRCTRVPASLLFAIWARTPTPRIECWTGPVDLVHGTNFVAPPSRAPIVVTVHDLAYVHRPELVTATSRRYDRLVRKALRLGAHVHAVSDHVAADVCETYDISPERVTRVYAGIAPTRYGSARAGHTTAGCERYVLALGSVEPRKNLPRLVAAFDHVAATDPDLHLVIAGPDGWGLADFDAATRKATHRTRVRRLGYVSDRDRADLLAGAEVFAYPSVDEGFGHPPLEAMDAGIPVVASSGGALPESCGGAALLPDPTDVDDIATAIETALVDTAVRTRLITAGRAQVARFTWSRAGDEMVALYQRVSQLR